MIGCVLIIVGLFFSDQVGQMKGFVLIIFIIFNKVAQMIALVLVI